MDEQEEFEFRYRYEQEQGASAKPESSSFMDTLKQTGKNFVGGVDAALTMGAQAVPFVGSGIMAAGALPFVGPEKAEGFRKDLFESGLGLGEVKPVTKAGEEVTEMVGKGAEFIKNEAGEAAQNFRNPFTGEKSDALGNAANLASDLILGGWGSFAPIPGAKGVRKAGQMVEKAIQPKTKGPNVKAAMASLVKPIDPPSKAGEGAFNEMQAQLRNGEHSPIDTSVPKITPMESVVQGLEVKRQQDAQTLIDQRQTELEMQVKKDAGLDFNAAERARQEKAPVPGLEQEHARVRNETIAAEVAKDSRVTKAEERAHKAEELYLRVAAAMESGKATQAHLRRVEKDMKNFQDALDSVKNTVEHEISVNARKNSPITSSGPMGRQRGAFNPEVFKEGFQKLKQLPDGTWLRAFSNNGTMTIEAVKDSRKLGGVVYEPANKYDEPSRTNLHAPMVGVNPEARGKGLATDMYKFAAELGNDVQQTKMLTDDGKKMWDSFERKGLAKTDPDTKLRYIPKGQRGYIMLEGKKKKALNNLATKLDIQDKLREIAPLELTPEAAIAEAKKGKDVEQNLLQKGINYLTKGGQYMSMKLRNPVVTFTVDNILTADRMARADIRDWVHERLGPAMRALSAKEQGEIWPVINMADMLEKPIDLHVLAENGFNERQLKLVEEHRAAMDYAFSMLNKAREAAGKKPISKRTAYAAMRATGDFRKMVYEVDAEGTKTVVGVIGSDYRTGLNKLQKQMEERGYTVGEERYFGGMPRERGSANEAFMHAIEMLAENDPKLQEFIDVLHDIRTTEAYNFLNAKTHTMQKKGVFGMEGRKDWLTDEENAKEGFKAQLNYLEAGIKWGHLSDATSKIKQVLDNNEIDMPNAKALSEKYLYNALGFNPSDFGRSLENTVSQLFKNTGVGYSVGRETMAVSRQITNSLLLSLNPRFWATNVVQPLQSMPAMKAALISRGLDAGFDFGTGYSYIVEGASVSMKKQAGLKLDAFEQDMVKYARDHHVFGSDMVEHSNRVRKDTVFYANKVASSVAGNIENATRQVMFYGFSKLLKENGMETGKQLFDAAHNLTDMTMNNYSAVERPQMYNSMGPVGDLAVNLQSYKHNELSRLAFFARMVTEDKALRPVATQLATTMAFAGIMGMTGFATADQIYKYITKKLGAPDSLTNRVINMSEGLNKKLHDLTGGKVDEPYLASHGVFSMMGLDMSKSLGLTEIVPDNPVDLVFPGGSKLGEIGGAAVDMARNPSEMNAKRLGRAAAPLGVQGWADNAWFTKETEKGSLVAHKDNLRGQAYRNKTDKVAKNFGFTGINESVQKQKTYNIERVSRDYADLRQKPLDRMRDTMYTDNTIDKKDIQEYLKYRGSVDTIETDINRYAMEQNMSAKDLALFRAATTESIAGMAKAQDYIRMFSK